MSQQTLELLSDEQVEPSLLESRYPEIIASVGSIDSYDSIVSVGSIASVASINSVDLIATEDSLAVKYSPDSEYSLSPLVKFYIEQDFVDITLEASVWGIDRRRNSHLFNFSDQLITGEGTYTFNTFVNSNKLDEDTGFFQDGPTDEIATQFRLISSDPALVGVNHTAWTNQVHGRY